MIALVTNDDGIEAEGLATLRRMAECHFDEVWTVAPAGAMSEVGHRVTTRDPIRCEERGSRSWAVSGSPADCVRVALARLLPQRPDFVLSGINHGGNLGRHDFAISGTVAAAREGAFLGIRGVAFSHFFRKDVPIDWTAAGERIERAFLGFREEHDDPGEVWCVNLPHPGPGDREPDVVRCEPEPAPLHVSYEENRDGTLVYSGDYHGRPRSRGTDVDVCFSGDIAVTRVRV